MENKIAGEHIASTVKRYRELNKWTRTELANRCGNISPDRITNIESGRYTPSLKTVLLMADAFGINAYEFFVKSDSKEVHDATIKLIDTYALPLLKEVLNRALESAVYEDGNARNEVAKHIFARDTLRGILPLANQKAIEQVVHTVNEMDPQTSEKMDKLVEIMGGKMRQ